MPECEVSCTPGLGTQLYSAETEEGSAMFISVRKRDPVWRVTQEKERGLMAGV